jgi:hypothetical protein
MATQRRLVLIAAMCTVLLPILALGRMPHDEVNLRYFAATLPWLAVIAGAAMEAMTWNLPPSSLARGVFGAASVLLATVDLFLAFGVRPRLAFSCEAGQLRGWLADHGSGCTVHQVSPLGWQVPRDLDCCLDAARSTAALVPGITFADRRAQAEPPPHDWIKLGPPPLPPLGPGCNLWYEGAICHLAPSQELRAQMGTGLDAIAASCAEWRKRTVGEALEEHWVSQRAIDPWFVDQDHRGVQIRLWRVQ